MLPQSPPHVATKFFPFQTNNNTQLVKTSSTSNDNTNSTDCGSLTDQKSSSVSDARKKHNKKLKHDA